MVLKRLVNARMPLSFWESIQVTKNNFDFAKKNYLNLIFICFLAFVSRPSSNLQHQIDNFYNFADMQMAV